MFDLGDTILTIVVGTLVLATVGVVGYLTVLQVKTMIERRRRHRRGWRRSHSSSGSAAPAPRPETSGTPHQP